MEKIGNIALELFLASLNKMKWITIIIFNLITDLAKIWIIQWVLMEFKYHELHTELYGTKPIWNFYMNNSQFPFMKNHQIIYNYNNQQMYK